ncbi:MAG: flagellar export protein FliJ [Nitrospirota bacterium]
MNRRKIKKVLDLKGFTKKQLEIELRKSKDELEIENARLDSTIHLFEKTIAEFNRKQNEGFKNALELDFFYSYFSHLNKLVDQQTLSVKKRLMEVELNQKALLNSHREKRLCEILHDKILHEEMKLTSKVEQKEIDFNFISRGKRR